jgi:hypothetical protein
MLALGLGQSAHAPRHLHAEADVVPAVGILHSPPDMKNWEAEKTAWKWHHALKIPINEVRGMRCSEKPQRRAS